SGGPQRVRVTGGAISQSVEFDEDQELRADRGKGAPTMVSGSVGGGLEINLSHGSFDDLIEGLLASTTSYVGTDNTLEVTDAVFAAGSISSATSGLAVLEFNQWFRIIGSASNDGIYKTSGTVVSDADSITLDTVVKDSVTESSVTCSMSSGRLKQGNDALRSFTFEREMNDVSRFLNYKECYASALSLSYTIGSPVAGTLSVVAAEPEVTGTVSLFPGIGSEVAATTTPRYNSVTGTYVLIDNADLGDSCMDSFSLNITANLRERRCLGSGLAPSGFAADPFTVDGTCSIFYGSSVSADLYDKKLEGVQILFSICIEDSTGNGYAITFPTATITEGNIDGSGNGSDVMMSTKFSGNSVPGQPTVIIDVLGSLA
ncbi:hypothetical protein KAU11_08380, partial [Candidatus Babeliales bacterium]|nr:hypothetical protein [Candidatus Babeliales bacterium]